MSAVLNLGPHADFIVASYAVTLAVVVLLIVWIAADHVVQRRKVAQLESQGITRRSAQARPPA